MCTKINIKEELTYNVVCSQQTALYKVLSSKNNKTLLNDKNDMQIKLTNYLAENLKISSNKIIGTIILQVNSTSLK